MVPGGAVRVGKLTRVSVVTEVEVNSRGDDEHVAHHAVLNRGAGAAGADDVGVAEIEAVVHQNSLKAHRGIDLAHAGHIQRNAILDVELVALKAADDIIFLAAHAVAFIVILRFTREVACHFAAFELGKDERLNGDGGSVFSESEGSSRGQNEREKQSKQFLHGCCSPFRMTKQNPNDKTECSEKFGLISE